MELHGTIQNGVVVFDETPALPEGTKVTIRVEQGTKPKEDTLGDRLLDLAGTIDDLPTDMARNHDHYIHGTPKEREAISL